MMHLLRIASWLACGIYATIPAYWMMVHPFAPRWRGARYKLTVLGPLWLLMWCVAWAASYPWRETLLYQSRGAWAVAPLFWVVSVFMYFNATRELSLMRVIGRHELEPDRHANVLITAGVHGLVRHPMYLGHVCTMLGFAIGAGTVACWALLLFALMAGTVMIDFEERELHTRFGTAWEEYCERTPAIFPLRKL